jgi:transposase
MMAQNDLVVVGIDVAKDKVDACIRRFTLRQTFPNTAQGHRKLVAWLRKYQVGKAVMEASGGYEREWRNVLHNAGIEVRIVDPRRVRSFALLFERGTRVGNTDFGKNERGIYFVAGLDGWNRVERA